MCFQRIIEAQFNLIQAAWANSPQVGGTTSGRDALIGQTHGLAVAQQWPYEYREKEPCHAAAFGDFVKMKGGEFFFAPSMAFLKTLAPPVSSADPA